VDFYSVEEQWHIFKQVQSPQNVLAQILVGEAYSKHRLALAGLCGIHLNGVN
jgi:hypothetical protein